MNIFSTSTTMIKVRKIFYTLTFLLVIFNTSFSQQSSWQWVSPLPQGNPLNGVWPINNNSVVAVGAQGTVIRTSNSGATWQVQTTVDGIIDQFLATQFVSSSVGWAVGEYGIVMKTTDGGLSWIYQDIPVVSDLFAVNFVSDSVGWVGGYRGIIYHTTNAGETWLPQNSTTKMNVNAIHFLNPLHGWAVGADSEGVVLKTTDGGEHWSRLPIGKRNFLFSLNFLSDSVGWAVGAQGTIMKTTNGGSTWSINNAHISSNLYSVQFIDTSNGWISGSYGQFLKTTDGGLTWQYPYKFTYSDIYSMRFVSPTHGWAVGDFGVILTTIDGGSTWNLQSTNVKTDLYDVFFVNPQIGWGVGDEGTIVKTTDNGMSWTLENSGTDIPLFSVYFVNDSIGWAVGDYSTIVATTDGGTTWLPQDTRRSESLYSVFFYTSTIGWAVGEGVILRTNTGGLSWIADSTSAPTSMYKTFFYNQLLGFAAGASGTVLRTTNGGNSWTELTTDIGQDLYDIKVLSSERVIAVGDLGTVIVSNDTGTTWTYPITPTYEVLHGVSFFSYSTGWAVGEYGTIMATLDGGQTWTLQNPPTYTSFFNVQVVRSGSGGVVFVEGYGNIVICASISPLPPRIWTGAIDTLWSNPSNWNPTGIPTKLDSVIIAVSSRTPFYNNIQQQMTIGSLNINPGAKLKIGSDLAQLVIQTNAKISGTLELHANATTVILVGGSFSIESGGRFDYGKSTLVFTNSGTMKGTFYNVILNSSSLITTSGNVTIKNSLFAIKSPTIRQSDTLTILNSDPDAFYVYDPTGGGTIKRAIQQGSTGVYYFESSATAIAFDGTGIYPDTILMTTHPNSLPAEGFSDQIFVRRYYDVIAHGGSNFSAAVCLRYDTSETTMDVSEIGFFRDSSDIRFNMGVDDVLDSDFYSICLDSAKSFYTWYLGNVDYFPQYPFEFATQLYILDNSLNKDSLEFGADVYATRGVDSSYDEVVLGPKPPKGTFDVRWRIDSITTTRINYQGYVTTANSQNMYKTEFQPGIGGYPITLSWDSTLLPTGMVFLKDEPDLKKLNVNMKTRSSFQITDTSIRAFSITHTRASSYHVSRGWNMISVPLQLTTYHTRSAIYPTSISSMFAFDSALGYVRTELIQPGPGYWLKFRDPQNIYIEGDQLLNDTIVVKDGWNMIGAISKPVAISNIVTIPSGIRYGNTFGFKGGYFVADSIQPGQAYWLKTLGGGKLILKVAGGFNREVSEQRPQNNFSSLNSITLQDNADGIQRLRFGKIKENEVNVELCELPPLPPAGIFDARFESHRFVEKLSESKESTTQLAILVQSDHYPITLHLNINQPEIQNITITDEIEGNIIGVHALKPNEKFKIINPKIHKLILTVKTNSLLPKEFVLYQNYPNPFNPATTIQFDIPFQSAITLKIYNILGQEVSTLLNNIDYDGGKHSIVWNAFNYASGVYFYQLIASSSDGHSVQFRQVKKLVLIK